ncbi:MAG: hypothetical protein JWP12_2069 [Bacteroidetes bacterium]|nr:hypothetical protein [Bacteroidota bacterium]
MKNHNTLIYSKARKAGMLDKIAILLFFVLLTMSCLCFG